MKSKIFCGFLFPLFLAACTGEASTAPASENDVDAARNFINAALKGDYQQARQYLLPDSVNTQYLDAFERAFTDHMTPEDKKGYAEASINILNVAPVNDSVTVVNYQNSFKKKQDSLKVVRHNGQWLIDLKYAYAAKNRAQ